MMNPDVMLRLANDRQRELIRRAELRRRRHPEPGPAKRADHRSMALAPSARLFQMK